MADPEQIYTEVLQEEQGKGVSPAVAEGRAKAARARAEQGSPHPKEPKWWPGAQPHLEGGNGAAPAAEEPVEETAEEPEAPAAAEPAAEAPAEEAPTTPEPEAPAAAAPPAPAEAPAASAAPAAAATPTSVAPEQRPAGVTHGVPTGTRLRPEDAVGTDAQFEGQQLVNERRKRIDEVVAAGGPPPATGPRSGQWALFLAYLAIVAFAIFFVVQNQPAGGGEGGGAPPEEPAGGGGTTVTAQNVVFDTEAITLAADEEASLEFVNDDASSVQHNVAIYEDDSAEKSLFQGEVIPGGQAITYDVPPLKKGSYYFQCDVHPGMNGEVTVE